MISSVEISVMSVFKLCGVIWIGVLLFILGIQDIKRKEISCWWLISLLPLIVIELARPSEIKLIERIFGILLGLFFVILSKVTRGQIGIGDGYVLCAIGLILGIGKCVILLSYAFLLTSVVSIVLLVFFRWNRKRTIPFVPFLFMGYLGCILIK
jgi:leader peptidase (prepilin peptidase)/N-methyltransferase